MKDKTHRQRIEDELFYCYDKRVSKNFLIDAFIILVGSQSIVFGLAALAAGISNIIR